jgi:ketosteroid isomerase-like protein
MQSNRPDVLAEVAEHFARYEAALAGDDAEAVVGFFAPDAVRFGVADHQVGLTEQLAWRRAQPPLPRGRALHDTRIAAYGADVAVVTTFFSYPGSPVAGRQSQTWVRLPEGWRIVTAHVSEPVPAPAAAPAPATVPGPATVAGPAVASGLPSQAPSAKASSMSSVKIS